MPFDQYALWVLAGLALLVVVRWLGRVRRTGAEWISRPSELRNADLAYAEQVFRAEGDISIVAKLDRAYRHRNGLITLVEFKTRHVDRVYLSDVIELSAQRVALEAQTKEVVTPYAFVLIQRPGSKKEKPHRVELLTHAEVMALAVRREGVLAGDVSPRYACSEGLCNRCAFKRECWRGGNG